MSIFDYEIFSTYGALDSDVFVDSEVGGTGLLGQPYSAYTLRTMAMDHNRLLTKPELLFNLVWPVTTHIQAADGETAETFGGIGVSAWKQIHPSIPVFKKPGHTLLNFRLTIRLSVRGDTLADCTLFVQVCTGALPFSSSASTSADNVVAITQNETDGFVDVSIDNIPMLAGSRDEITIYVSGDITTETPSTGTYGSPASGTLDQAGDFIQDNAIFDGDATWNITNSSNRTLATEGYVLVFTDAAGNELVPPRNIISIQNFNLAATGRLMMFDPPLTPSELVLVQSTQTYSIFAVPNFWIANLMGFSVARSE